MLGPILRSFIKHRLTVALLVFEVAVTSALACNVIHLAMVRFGTLNVPSGVNESHLALVDSVMLDMRTDYVAAQSNDLEALRHLPGVTAAAAVDSVPLSKSSWTLPLESAPPGDQAGVIRKPSIYTGTPGTMRVLGLHLLSGRDFLDNEFQPVGSAHGYIGITTIGTGIVTRHLADEYFPHGDALGRNLYLPNGHPIRIVGIVEHLLRPELKQVDDADDSMLVPLLPDQSEVTYALRTNMMDDRDLLAKAKATLIATDSRRLVRSMKTYGDLRADYFAEDQAMLHLLYAAGAGLITITIVSVAGLANFWVLQRKRQIGIRRAIGATRKHICRYFQLENLILVGAGAGLGILIAPFLGHFIMSYYEAPALPYTLLPIVAVLFCCIGQLSVLGPALSASRIAPMAAIRQS